MTNSFSRENLNYQNGVVKNIHYGDIHTKFQTLFDLSQEYVPFINEGISIVRIPEDFYCKEGDIVFADASEDLNDVGKSIEIVSLNGQKVLAGLHTLLARPKIGYFKKRFPGHLFKSSSVRLQIKKEAQGSKVLSINVGRISKVELSFPPLVEQQKISTFLSLIDERIQTQSKIIQRLETSMQVLRDGFFKQRLKFKINNCNDFPVWQDKELGDVANRITFKNTENNQNVLTISAQLGLINQLEFFNKSVSAKDITKYYLLRKNDFAYNKSYSKGYPMGAIKRLNRYKDGVVSTLYICFSFNPEVNSEFMEHYFESGVQVPEIEKVAQEGARNHGLLNIGISDFFKIKIKIPPFQEQTRISTLLSFFDGKIAVEKKTLAQYELQKKYLLFSMFV